MAKCDVCGSRRHGVMCCCVHCARHAGVRDLADRT